jgi:hypothetical protein
VAAIVPVGAAGLGKVFSGDHPAGRGVARSLGRIRCPWMRSPVARSER